MFTDRRLACALLGLAGVLLVHEIAYRATDLIHQQFAAPSHAHLSLLWTLLAPVGALSLTFLAIRQARALRLAQPVRTRSVAAAIAAPYLALELTEFLQSGSTLTEAMTSLPVILGLLATVPVAWLLTYAISGVASIVDALSISSHRYIPAPVPVPALVPTHAAPHRRAAPVSFHRRGPPSLSR